MASPFFVYKPVIPTAEKSAPEQIPRASFEARGKISTVTNEPVENVESAQYCSTDQKLTVRKMFRWFTWTSCTPYVKPRRRPTYIDRSACVRP